jgi:hypothetical protein
LDLFLDVMEHQDHLQVDGLPVVEQVLGVVHLRAVSVVEQVVVEAVLVH